MKITFETPKGTNTIDLTPFKNDLIIPVQLDLSDDESMFSMFCSGYSDIFGRDYVGYWAYGVKFFDETNSWLCIEDSHEFEITDEIIQTAINQYNEHCLKNWEGFPEGSRSWTFEADVHFYWNHKQQKEKILCFVIDPKFACNAIVEAFKKWGKDSIDNWDADTVDFGAQMALYGEIKWG